MKITISAQWAGNHKNATPAVVEALRSLREAGGGTLCFEAGDYHFFPEGTEPRHYALSNNSMGEKSVVFLLEHMRGITVDGCGSKLIFHGNVFPFAVDRCEDVTLKNMVIDRGTPMSISMVVRNVREDGFDLEIDKARFPFRLERGALIFPRELGECSGLNTRFSLHSSDRFRVRYLLTGDTVASRENLPVEHMWVDAAEIESGVRLTYRQVEGASPCLYEEGESLFIVLDGGREVALFFLNEAHNVRIENVTVRQSSGMGVLGQLSENITVRGFRTDYQEQLGGVAIDHDAFHFVNCSGSLELCDCHVTHPGDDILNVHGMYTSLLCATDRSLRVKIMHQQQYGFCPCRPGDRLSLIERSTLDVIGHFTVTDFRFEADSNRILLLDGRLEGDPARVANAEEVLVENTERMPNVHLHHNFFYHYPNIRLSGVGKILVEHNHIELGKSAFLLQDLANYWYESGRIRDLVIRHNRMVSCNALGKMDSFIQIGVSGLADEEAPTVHGRIEISDNEFVGLARYAVTAGGVRELIIENNRSENGQDLPVRINGADALLPQGGAQ